MQGRNHPVAQQRGLPHVVVTVVEVGPLVLDDLGVRDGLGVGLTPVAQVDRAPDAVSVMVSCGGFEGAEVSEVGRVKDETGFLPGLADGGLQRGLSRLDLASRQDDVIGSPLADVEAGSAAHQAHGSKIEYHAARVLGAPGPIPRSRHTPD